MGSSESKYGLEHAFGKTTIPRITYPSIRGAVRRTDPDGGHASPYFLGLNTKTLILAVTPVGGTITVIFTSDDVDDAIAAINAASVANLKGIDEDGYIRLVNLNGGGKNSLTIVGGTALALLGFIASPEPGSVSYSGDIATSSPGRTLTAAQNNPQGTVLVAGDENLTSSVLNRAIAGALVHVERLARELDIEVPYVKRVLVTVNTHVPSGKKYFIVQDNSLRFPIEGFGIGALPIGLASLDGMVNLRSFPGDTDYLDPTQDTTYIRALSVYYNDGTNPTTNPNLTFATWGAIDGKSIFGSQLKNKQVAVNISAVRGNIIEAPTATFVAKICQVGDTVIIEGATNDVPFNHNGEYIITEIIDETKIAVRAKASHESLFVAAARPTELNASLPGGTVYGTVRVIVGSTIPASNLMFEVSPWAPNATQFYARLICLKRARDLAPGELGDILAPQQAALGTTLFNHWTGASAHIAANIDAGAVAGSPHSLGAGTVAGQLAALLALINAIPATEIAYGGGIAWADGVTNPATTVEAQLDKILSNLAGAGVDGTAKIRAFGSAILANGTLRAQLEQLATEWFRLSANNTVAGANQYTGDQEMNNSTLRLGVGNAQTKAMLLSPANPAATEHKLLWDLGLSPPGVIPHLRLYLNDINQIEIVWNAKWVPASGWLSDDNAQNSIRLLVGGDGMFLQYKSPPGAAFWLEATWASGGNFLQVNPTAGLLTVVGDILATDYQHGDRTFQVDPQRGYGSATATGLFSVTLANGAGTWNIPILGPLRTGDRIKSLVISMFGNGITDVAAHLDTFERGDTASIAVTTININNTPALWTDVSLDVAPDTVLAPDTAFLLAFDATNGAGLSVGMITVTYDHP